MNKKLPQIIIPKEKITMFLDWWDTDIRFEDHVPKAFDEGYLIYQLPIGDFSSIQAKEGIKYLAKITNTTYRMVENKLKEINNRDTVIYFKFIQDNKLYFERYENNELKSKGTGDIGKKDTPDPSIEMLLHGNGINNLLFQKASSDNEYRF